jgi:hypothetical protein
LVAATSVLAEPYSDTAATLEQWMDVEIVVDPAAQSPF